MAPILRRIALGLSLVVTTGAVAGCAFFTQGWSAFRRAEGEGGAVSNTVLKPIPTSRTALQVEIMFVERPDGDPLMGEGLWRELDQVGALDRNVRESLQSNGFRVGIASSSPPRALQTLLGLSTEIHDSLSPEDSKRLVGRRLALASGAETEVQTSPNFESCTIRIADGDRQPDFHFEGARCLFRMKAQRVQDGWAKLEFTPEVHHGDNRLRHTATEAGWELRTTQKVAPFYPQRFDITLNLGEMAVIGATGDDPKSLGRHFFVNTAETRDVRRALIVRLADMTRTESAYAKKP